MPFIIIALLWPWSMVKVTESGQNTPSSMNNIFMQSLPLNTSVKMAKLVFDTANKQPTFNWPAGKPKNTVWQRLGYFQASKKQNNCLCYCSIPTESVYTNASPQTEN